MRLRHILGIASVAALVGGGIWFFLSGTNGNAVGPGGLPLIKADTRPIKIAPEDPGGEVMPNADSTVFSAMGADTEIDPSMENLKLPAPARAQDAQTPDFAGLKTGFAVPPAPPRTTESLFAATPVQAPEKPAPAPEKTTNDYISGIAPKALASKSEPTPAPQPEPVKEKKTDVSKPAPVKTAIEKEEPARIAKTEEASPAPASVVTDNVNPAQAMEEQEKAIITPSAKPAVPQAKPVIAKSATQTPAPAGEEPVKVQAHAPEEKEVASTSSKPGYYMQLASTPSAAEAPKLWARLKGKYGAALSGLNPVYQTATVPGKGEYIRVQAGPLTQQQANERCKQLRAQDAKGGCLVFKR